MFGIHFDGHPDRVAFDAADGKDTRCAKIYPLGYESRSAPSIFEEINLRKPYAKE